MLRWLSSYMYFKTQAQEMLYLSFGMDLPLSINRTKLMPPWCAGDLSPR